LSYWLFPEEIGTREPTDIPNAWVAPMGMTAFNTYKIASQYEKHCRPGTGFNGETYQKHSL